MDHEAVYSYQIFHHELESLYHTLHVEVTVAIQTHTVT